MEELAYADFNLANAAIPVMLMTALIARHGSDKVREAWLRPLTEGDAYVCLGLTEPGCGSDVTAIATTATATPDGYLISGDKASVTMLSHGGAIIVIARTVRDGQNTRALGVPGPAGRRRDHQIRAPGHRLGADGPRPAAPRPGRGAGAAPCSARKGRRSAACWAASTSPGRYWR